MASQQGPSPLAYAGLGFELVAPVVAGAYGGYWLDGWLDTAPWLLVAGFLLGIIVGSLGFWRRVRGWQGQRRGNGS